ncbi:hypothetical protein I7I51_02995 [Histoplasma capsulatum]|uniref:Phenazine biosynthesis PhzC/PhzF protein n=1 Tax=Ajellomyces capsulatus TaxID=5037 RepID=A0A8A1MPV2_AJECA|nr:predicted protein [Histoplasma mississippiense (nom. inval.)]EDN11308.1 predicted protein [Histoplasma mississippiense (nom. inval.)]QSS66784.1 hypothetical protein I7I51_02995 [Histoplasma capsulatum]
MAQSLHFVTLDVFTTSPFAGNPLALVFLSDNIPITQTQKQAIAREFNFSETIFVHPSSWPQQPRTIDIFTTLAEIPFAGHPTIGATSWLLLHSKLGNRDEVPPSAIATKAGEIPISISAQDPKIVSALIPHNVHIHSRRFSLEDLLKLHPSVEPYLDPSKHADGFPIVSVVKGMTAAHVRLPSLEALAAATTASGAYSFPAISTEAAGYFDPGWDTGIPLHVYFYVKDVWDEVRKTNVIRSRMFFDASEDPATGSAASGLVSYLALTGIGDGNGSGSEHEMLFHVVQGVEMGRRSDIGLKVVLKEGGREIDKIQLSGSAVKVSEGDIVVGAE